MKSYVLHLPAPLDSPNQLSRAASPVPSLPLCLARKLDGDTVYSLVVSSSLSELCCSAALLPFRI